MAAMGASEQTPSDARLSHFPELEAFSQVKCDFSGVIFDYDGTLVDSMWVWESIDERFCEEYQLVLPDNYEEIITPMTFEETARWFCDRLDGELTVEDTMRRFDELALEEYSERVMCKPGVKNYLKELRRRGVSIAVATSLSRTLIRASMEYNGIADSFDAVAFCDECRGKSEPDVYLLAASRIGSCAADCLVFEDISEGILSARRVGMTTCAVIEPYKHQNSEEIRSLADFSIESFEQLYLQGK